MDTESLAQLIDRYGNMVLRLAYTYLKNKADAEDIVQDVFLQVMEKQPEFQNAEHEKAWLVRTTINHCKNRLHTFWNRNKCSIDEIAEISKCDTYQLDSDVLKAVLSLRRQSTGRRSICIIMKAIKHRSLPVFSVQARQPSVPGSAGQEQN